jgi:hypothetical protein
MKFEIPNRDFAGNPLISGVFQSESLTKADAIPENWLPRNLRRRELWRFAMGMFLLRIGSHSSGAGRWFAPLLLLSHSSMTPQRRPNDARTNLARLRIMYPKYLLTDIPEAPEPDVINPPEANPGCPGRGSREVRRCERVPVRPICPESSLQEAAKFFACARPHYLFL